MHHKNFPCKAISNNSNRGLRFSLYSLLLSHDSSREAFSFPMIISASRSSHAFPKPLLACIVDGGIDSRARWCALSSRGGATGNEACISANAKLWRRQEIEKFRTPPKTRDEIVAEDFVLPDSTRIFFVPTQFRDTVQNKTIQCYYEIFIFVATIFETL